MKKVIIICLMAALLTQAVSALAYPFLPAEGILRVNAYLRKEPSTKSPAILTVLQGTVVIIKEIVNDWMHVQVGISSGYIRGDLFVDNTKMQSPFAAQAPLSQAATPSHMLPQNVLKLGMRGEAVLRLQEALDVLGFSVAMQLDGIFGDSTEDMVKAFQANYGINPDGIVGQDTHEALDYALDYYHRTTAALKEQADGQ